jgi:endonuclease/exonuclease/phosphatase family metal-dependent hydrolase
MVGTDYYSVDSAGFQIPNGVISKWPITSSGYWDDPYLSNRELAWAVVDIPGDRDIFAISVHLHTSPPSDQVAAAVVIANEVESLKNANPGKYYYVVGGDFNGPSAVSGSGFGKHGDFYVSSPHPADDNGNQNTNSNRNSQYDFVIAGTDLHAFQVPVVYHSNKDSSTLTYTNGLVFDTRIYNGELAEFYSPASSGDSAASQMQHMGVVKDFVITE